MSQQEQIEQKRQRIIDLTKCLRQCMKDAAASNDTKLRQGYWHTAELWGCKIDAVFVEIELLKSGL